MKVFAIFLCVAVGHVFGERETNKAGAKKLRVRKDVMKDTGATVYGDSRRIVKDANFEGRYSTINRFDQIHPTKAKDVYSVVRETSRNLRPRMYTSTPKTATKRLEFMYLRKPATQFEVLQTSISKPENRSSETEGKTLEKKRLEFIGLYLQKLAAELEVPQTSISKSRNRSSETESKALENKRLEFMYLRKPATEFEVLQTSISNPGYKSSETERKTLEKKRSEFMLMRKHATELEVPKTKINHTKNRRSKTGRKTLRNLLRSSGLDISRRKKSNSPDDEKKLLRVRRQVIAPSKKVAAADDPNDAILSYRAYNEIRKKLPVPMRLKIRETVLAEDTLLDNYANSGVGKKSLLDAYNVAKKSELTELKALVGKAGGSSGTEGQQLIANYKALLKGVPWNFVKLREKYRAFFGKPSPALTEYETLKQNELTSVDGFLSGSIQAGGGLEEPTAATGEANVPAPQVVEANVSVPQVVEASVPVPQVVKAAGPAVQVVEAAILALQVVPGGQIATIEEEQASSPEVPGKVPVLSKGLPVGQVDKDPEDILASFDKYLKLSAYFSADLKLQMFHTDSAEKKLLLSYIKSNAAPKDLLNSYYAQRKNEIELLKRDLVHAGPKATAILAAYKARRKGVVWNYLKNTDDQRRNFFNTVSSGRTEYEALKRKELDIDGYLSGELVVERTAPGVVAKQPAGLRAEAGAEDEEEEEDEEAVVKRRRESVVATVGDSGDPANPEESRKLQNSILLKLPERLRSIMKLCDKAEEQLLDMYAQSYSDPTKLIAGYKEAQAIEKKILTEEVKATGVAGPGILANYRKLRKGSAWNSLKNDEKYKYFFLTPSGNLVEYEKLKRKELSIGDYLKGLSKSLTVEENKKAEEAKKKAKETERVVRATESDRVEVESNESTEDVVAGTGDDVGADVKDDHGGGDDVKPTDVVHVKTTTNTTNVKSRNKLVRVAILFALAMQVMTTILILGPEVSNLLTDWWRKREASAALPGGEKERSNAGAGTMLPFRSAKYERLLSSYEGLAKQKS